MYLTIAKWVGGVLLGLMVAWIVYAGLVRPTTKPNPTTKNEAENMTNYTFTPRVSFGCANFKVYKDGKLEKEIVNSVNSVGNSGSIIPDGGK